MRGLQVEPTLVQHPQALLSIGALQAHHHRDVDMHLLDGLQDALRDQVNLGLVRDHDILFFVGYSGWAPAPWTASPTTTR